MPEPATWEDYWKESARIHAELIQVWHDSANASREQQEQLAQRQQALSLELAALVKVGASGSLK